MAYESGAGKSDAWKKEQWKKFWNEKVPKMKSGEIVIPVTHPDRFKVKNKDEDDLKIASTKRKNK